MSQFDKLYEDGISIDELAKSLMTLSHKLALIKSGVQKNIQNLNPELIQKLQTLSENYEMDFIIRFWELNQKFLNELSDVFDEKQCFEMVIMRLCYASLLPTPFEIINKIEKKNNNKDISRISAVNENIQPKDKNESISNFGNNVLIQDNLLEKIEKNLEKNDGDSQEVKLKKFSELIKIIEDQSEVMVAYYLKNSFRLVEFLEPGDGKTAGNIELENIDNSSESKKIYGKLPIYLKKLQKKDGFCPFLVKKVSSLFKN